jgi:hypothetical protein
MNILGLIIIWDIAKNYLPDNKVLVDKLVDRYL